MVMLDANIILRYLLNDNEKMASEAEAIIKNMPVQVNIEIVAEVIYVLKGYTMLAERRLDSVCFNFYRMYMVRYLDANWIQRRDDVRALPSLLDFSFARAVQVPLSLFNNTAEMRCFTFSCCISCCIIWKNDCLQGWPFPSVCHSWHAGIWISARRQFSSRLPT